MPIARSRLTFAVRDCFEQTHRGDHFIFEDPWNAFSRNEQCLQKLIAQPSVFRIEGPMCRWHQLSGESGFVREPTSWWTNHRDLESVCDSVSRSKLDRHAQVKKWHGISSVSCGFLGVFPEGHS